MPSKKLAANTWKLEILLENINFFQQTTLSRYFFIRNLAVMLEEAWNHFNWTYFRPKKRCVLPVHQCIFAILKWALRIFAILKRRFFIFRRGHVLVISQVGFTRFRCHDAPRSYDELCDPLVSVTTRIIITPLWSIPNSQTLLVEGDHPELWYTMIDQKDTHLKGLHSNM